MVARHEWFDHTGAGVERTDDEQLQMELGEQMKRVTRICFIGTREHFIHDNATERLWILPVFGNAVLVGDRRSKNGECQFRFLSTRFAAGIFVNIFLFSAFPVAFFDCKCKPVARVRNFG